MMQSNCSNQYEVMNYGLTFATTGKAHLLKELDSVLQSHNCFLVQKDSWDVVARKMSPDEFEVGG